MPDAAMAAIEALGVDPVEVTHPRGQIARGRFAEQVVMVVHQTVRVTALVEAVDDAGYYREPQLAVRISSKDRLACIPPGGDVVERSRVLQT